MTSAVILAGGLGVRLRSAVPDLPKPMAPINGRPFLEYLMSYWIGQGVTKFVLLVGYKRELIMSHFGRKYMEIPIEYIEEETPLGTGGGLLLAAKKLTHPFILLNGDTYFGVQLKNLMEFHVLKGSKFTFSLFQSNETGRYGGVELESNNRIRSLNTEKSNVGDLANGGVYLVDPGIFNSIEFIIGQKYSLEDDVIPALLGGRADLFGVEINGPFLDIGLPRDYYQAADILARI